MTNKRRKRSNGRPAAADSRDGTERQSHTPGAGRTHTGSYDRGGAYEPSGVVEDVPGPEQCRIQRALRGTDTSRDDVPEQVLDVLGSGGKPLAESVRDSFETEMDADFSNVRIHTGSDAAAAADAIDARAFTCGNDIVFNAGEYDPNSPGGQHLLAHELAHVKQQTGGAISMMPQENTELAIDPDPQREREADEMAQRVMAGAELGIPRMGDTEFHVQRMGIGETVSRLFGSKQPAKEARAAVERAEQAQREVEELQSTAKVEGEAAETDRHNAASASAQTRNKIEVASRTNHEKRSEWGRKPAANATEQELRDRERARQDGEMRALSQLAEEWNEAAVLADSDRDKSQHTETKASELLEAVTAEVETARAAAAAAEENGKKAEAKRKAEEANAAATRAEEIRQEASGLRPSDVRIEISSGDDVPQNIPQDAPASGFYSQLGRNFLGACGRTGDRHLGFMFRNGNHRKPSAWGGVAGTAASAVNLAAMVFAITNAELYSAGELDEAGATNFLTSLGIGAAAGGAELLGLPSTLLGGGVSLIETLGRAGGHLAGRTDDPSVTAVDWFHDHADSFNASAITQFGIGASMLAGDTHLAEDLAVPAAVGLAAMGGGIYYQDEQAASNAARAEAHQHDTNNERTNPATGAPMIEDGSHPNPSLESMIELCSGRDPSPE